MSAIDASHAAKSASATAKRSSCWSPTSSARRGRCATCNCSAGSASLRYGIRDPRRAWPAAGLLWREDCDDLERRHEFLLWLRNELHFHAGKASDVLNRAEQVRIAECRGYQPAAGMLPVEQFMQDYFRHTNQVSHIVAGS